jgi:hypothetical protein
MKKLLLVALVLFVVWKMYKKPVRDIDINAD